jgi:ATPase family associated with various cellular activities (AAA)
MLVGDGAQVGGAGCWVSGGRGARDGMATARSSLGALATVERLKPEQLAVALRDLVDWARAHAPAEESPLRTRIVEHLGCDPAEMPVVSRSFSPWQRANLQVAIDAYLEGEGREHEFVGMSAQRGWRMGLAELAQKPSGAQGMIMIAGPGAGPQEHTTVQVGERTIVCVASGLFLVASGNERVVIALRASDERMGPEPGIELEVLTPAREPAERVLAELAELMHTHNVYRGQVLEVEGGHFGEVKLAVRALPKVEREHIVLPEGVLERIERHTLGFAEQAERLRAAGRHVKRGLLLYGPPGTGKTLTAMYLTGRMPKRTVLILTGAGLHAIGEACSIARELAPSMVIMEDIDLVALDRDEYQSNALLFELLNEMDGMQEDLDVIFLLTTNRADRLESALAARPGRVDLACELPLPDAEGRRRLLALYGEGLALAASDLPTLMSETEGASPAFIRELLRRAALLATESSDGRLTVDAAVLEAALKELTSEGGPLTAKLLGMS